MGKRTSASRDDESVPSTPPKRTKLAITPSTPRPLRLKKLFEPNDRNHPIITLDLPTPKTGPRDGGLQLPTPLPIDKNHLHGTWKIEGGPRGKIRSILRPCGSRAVDDQALEDTSPDSGPSESALRNNPYIAPEVGLSEDDNSDLDSLMEMFIGTSDEDERSESEYSGDEYSGDVESMDETTDNGVPEDRGPDNQDHEYESGFEDESLWSNTTDDDDDDDYAQHNVYDDGSEDDVFDDEDLNYCLTYLALDYPGQYTSEHVSRAIELFQEIDNLCSENAQPGMEVQKTIRNMSTELLLLLEYGHDFIMEVWQQASPKDLRWMDVEGLEYLQKVLSRNLAFERYLNVTPQQVRIKPTRTGDASPHYVWKV